MNPHRHRQQDVHLPGLDLLHGADVQFHDFVEGSENDLLQRSQADRAASQRTARLKLAQLKSNAGLGSGPMELLIRDHEAA